MKDIYNVMLVSNSVNYAEEFKRISQFNGTINLLGLARGIHDFQMKMNKNVQIVLISDVLTDGSLHDLLEFLSPYDVMVFAIITQNISESILNSYGVSYIYETDMMPSEVVNFLEESLQSFSDSSNPRENQPYQDDDITIESHQSRFSEGYQNSPTENNYPYQNQQNSQQNQDYSPSQFQRKNNLQNQGYGVNQNRQNTYQQGYSSMPERNYSQNLTNRGNPYQNQGTSPLPNRFDNSRNGAPQNPHQNIPQKQGITTMGVLKPKVVCFTSAKGGVGKSSIAIEVASCLAERAKEVDANMNNRGANGHVQAVLVDLNCAFGTIASTLPCVSDMKNPPTLADWVLKLRDKIIKGLSTEDKRELMSQEKPRYASFIYKMNRNALSFTKQEVYDLLVKDNKTGLYVLPTISSNFDIQEIENEFIEIIVEELSKAFDAVILDTGNNFEGFTQTAFRVADEIYVVAQPNTQVCVIIKNLLRDSVSGLGIDISKFRLIINHPQTNKQSITDSAMQQSLNIPLAGGISHDENMLLAHDAGRFYSIYNKKKQAAKDIILIANQVLPLWNVQGSKKKQSFLSKMFGK